MRRPRTAPRTHTTTVMITITTMIMGRSTLTTTTTIKDTLIARTTTPAAVIQITGTTMGIANDLEAERPELPMTAVRR